jgi:hypothetical protein
MSSMMEFWIRPTRPILDFRFWIAGGLVRDFEF